MKKEIFAVVFFSTGWGPTKGGINSLNFDLCNAMGDLADRKQTKVYCICEGGITELERVDAQKHNVELVGIDVGKFKKCEFGDVLPMILNQNYNRIFWVGHDIITGKQAIACREGYNIGKVVIFNHMHYIDYYNAAKSPEACLKKDNEQKEIFSKADFAIAVGPKLLKSLKYKIYAMANAVPIIGQIIPGMAQIEPILSVENIVKSGAVVLFTGRLEKDNDPIKQFSIPLYAVSDLRKQHYVKFDEIIIKLFGLDVESEVELEKKVAELKSSANNRAECAVNVFPLSYTSDRNTLFREISTSFVSVMPSISEGFGLSGFESIAAGVPVIITESSGLYEFLDAEGLSGYVQHIDVQGNILPDKPNETDVNNVYKIFQNMLTRPNEFKKKALKLREKIIELGYTWGKAAKDVYELLIPEMSDMCKLFYKMIAYPVFDYLDNLAQIADNYANKFTKEISDIFRIDKNAILSSKIDTISDIPGVIMSYVGYQKTQQYNNIIEIFCKNLDEFLNKIINDLKNLNIEDDILCRYIAEREQINEILGEDKFIKKIDSNSSINFTKRKGDIVQEVRRCIQEHKINAVFPKYKKTILKYHNVLRSVIDIIDFQGLSVIFSDDPRYSRIPLSNIYVPMNLRSERLWGNEEDEEQEYTMFSNSVRQCQRLIIKGDPGSGKSTYLKKQLLDYSNKNAKNFCIFIKVSEFSEWLNKQNLSKNSFEEYIKDVVLKNISDIDTITLQKAYEDCKYADGVCYFVDGLDEVQDIGQKEKVNQAIANFIQCDGDCKFIMTSRIIGLDVSLFEPLKFTIDSIDPLAMSSIEEYVDKWYGFIKGILLQHKKDDYINNKATELKTFIGRDINLKEVARNPLMLSIIAILHYQGIRLPNNKAALYDTITKTLLQTWIQHRHFTTKYDIIELTEFFSRVAYYIIDHNYGDMTIYESELKSIYRQYCADNLLYDRKIENLLPYISKDAGVLIDKGGQAADKKYGFIMHRQFTEYYAAMELEHKLHNKSIKLSKILEEAKWTEVSMLMSGYMSTQGEAGKERTDELINKLLKIDIKPINDFGFNLQLILKWIANNAFLKFNTLNSLFEKLKPIFNSSNRYRVIQFRNDIVNAFGSEWYRMRFCKFLNDLLDSEDYNAVRNGGVIINTLLENKELHRDALDQITKDRIIKALKQIVEKNDFYMLVWSDGCYHTLFVEFFVDSVNHYFKTLKKGKLIWVTYTASYAFEKRKKCKSIDDLCKLIEQESGRIDDDTIRNEFIHAAILWGIAIDVAEGEKTIDLKKLDLDKFGCKELLNSAIELGKTMNDCESMGDFCANYVGVGMRMYHLKNEDGHTLTVYIYNKETKVIEKHQIVLSKNFCLQDIKTQIKNQKINAYLSEFDCINELSGLELTKDKLQKIFNQVYDNGYLLTERDWHQFIIDRIAKDGEVFYKNYETIKRAVKFSNDLDVSSLEGEYLIYFKYLLKQVRDNYSRYVPENDLDFFNIKVVKKPHGRMKITKEDKNYLVNLYNKENDNIHKNIIYEILHNLYKMD